MDASLSLAVYAEVWLRDLAPRVRPRTLETYRDLLAHHILPALGRGTPLRALTRARLRAFLLGQREAGYSGAYVRLMLAVLRGLLTHARLEGRLLRGNPTEGLGRLVPRRRAARRVLRRDELRRLLRAGQAVHATLGCLFVVAARTGLRLGEVLGLQWGDLDLSRRRLTVQRTLDWRRRAGPPKGGEVATLPLSREATQALAALAEGRDGLPWVFHGPSGRPWSRVYVRRILERACDRAGVPRIAAHGLRHAFVTQLAENGTNPWAIRDLARHRSIVTTEVYIHTAARYRADVDRLDAPRRR